MEHQANEHIENGLKYQKGGNRSQNSRASTRKTHRYGHTSDQRGPQLKKITLTRQKRHAQRAQDFKSDRLLDVHHKHPIAEGVRRTTLNDLTVLCANCHRLAHFELRQAVMSV